MRFLAAWLCLMGSGIALADSPNQRLFQAMDLDGDGYVSIAEAAGETVVVQRFDRADRDRDGKLSPKEFANLRKVKVRYARSKRDDRSAAAGASAKRVSSN